MVFELPAEFCVLDAEVSKLLLGVKLSSFEKPEKLGNHMRPLFVKGFVEGKPLQRIMVDEGVGVNVTPVATFDKLGFKRVS
jgi:hypothetical protein